MFPESVKPKRRLTGTTHEKSNPGWVLRVGSRKRPGVLASVRSLSRNMANALTLRTGRTRSKAPRGTMFTEPARAEPGDSGVGE